MQDNAELNLKEQIAQAEAALQNMTTKEALAFLSRSIVALGYQQRGHSKAIRLLHGEADLIQAGAKGTQPGY